MGIQRAAFRLSSATIGNELILFHEIPNSEDGLMIVHFSNFHWFMIEPNYNHRLRN